ncbi:MAG: hypothetical protein ACOZQL_07215 [Myxococcota bacterium]
MKLVIAPEPAPWLEPLLDSLDRRECLVIAPWAVPGVLAPMLPRHALRGVRQLSLPGWALVRAASRRAAAAIGHGAELRLTLELRQAVDLLVSRWVPDDVTQIFAPSLCALRTFARAPRAERVLLHDLPVLRQLHRDLDDAAEALPEAGFLRNFRAEPSIVARQEQEHVLATRVLVGGHYARKLLAKRVEATRLGALPSPRPTLLLSHRPDSPFVLLAGTTASRHGLEVALAAVERTKERTLLARRGPGTLASSLEHPRLHVLSRPPPPVRAVIAPAWVECCSPETSAAARGGVPLLATERARGWFEATVVQPGDASGLARELDRQAPVTTRLSTPFGA